MNARALDRVHRARARHEAAIGLLDRLVAGELVAAEERLLVDTAHTISRMAEQALRPLAIEPRRRHVWNREPAA